MQTRIRFVAGFFCGALISLIGVAGLRGSAAANPQDAPKSDPRDSEELAQLYTEDQADRMPAEGKSIDWSVVGPRDRNREGRVRALYETNAIQTGKDYHRAAMILQHAAKPDDYLLAHEFCVVALAKGERDARWLAAATEDRYLMNIGRPQRFGTQYRSTAPETRMKLYEVGPGVTDGLRRELGVPTLAQAREREDEMNGTPKAKKALEKGEAP
jgi:hypothetical protein